MQPLPPPEPPPVAPKPDVEPHPPSPRSEGAAAAPKLVAPPPEPARAATQDRDAKPANLAPDEDRTESATHEARPADVPRTLATSAADASFAVPAPLPPKPDPLPKPAPPVVKKVPSEADKLAAALPMDTSAMPMSFRSVLAGNGAQVSAAYKGLVYGRFNRNPAIAERAQRQNLKGQVIVAFTIDDTGKLSQLAVVQSSGNADVDALGLEMIRSAAPFPPPPPEAQRSFTPALSFGP
jgi:protein TonB